MFGWSLLCHGTAEKKLGGDIWIHNEATAAYLASDSAHQTVQVDVALHSIAEIQLRLLSGVQCAFVHLGNFTALAEALDQPSAFPRLLEQQPCSRADKLHGHLVLPGGQQHLLLSRVVSVLFGKHRRACHPF